MEINEATRGPLDAIFRGMGHVPTETMLGFMKGRDAKSYMGALCEIRNAVRSKYTPEEFGAVVDEPELAQNVVDAIYIVQNGHALNNLTVEQIIRVGEEIHEVFASTE